MSEMSRAEVEAYRAEVEAKSIGPVGSAVVLAGHGPEVFFKCRWDQGMQRVERAARGMGEIMLDSETQWGLIRQEGTILLLNIEWPEIGVEVSLYFPLSKWRVELGMVKDQRGVLTLVPEHAKGEEMLKRGVSLETVEHDILEPTLRAFPS